MTAILDAYLHIERALSDLDKEAGDESAFVAARCRDAMETALHWMSDNNRAWLKRRGTLAEYDECIARISRHIDNSEYVLAREALEALRACVGNYDTELIRLATMLRFLEMP